MTWSPIHHDFHRVVAAEPRRARARRPTAGAHPPQQRLAHAVLRSRGPCCKATMRSSQSSRGMERWLEAWSRSTCFLWTCSAAWRSEPTRTARGSGSSTSASTCCTTPRGPASSSRLQLTDHDDDGDDDDDDDDDDGFKS
eukprot:1906560-Rhodomonas_salina.2